MRLATALRYGVTSLALGGVALFALGSMAPPAQSQSNLIQDGKVGFVMADISYGFTNQAGEAQACPSGLSMNSGAVFAASAEGQRREGESDAEYNGRLRAGAMRLATGPGGENLCANPEAGAPDPNMHPVVGAFPVYGIDLDGQNSTATGRAASATCAHQDFRGMNGERGIDNQFYRAIGCTRTFQLGGQGNDFASEMLTGSWGILIELEDVQDLRNDNNVTVKFFANNDPVQLSPTREPLFNATYAAQQDPRYQATTRGRIVNGVLTTDPVDTRFHYVVNSIRLDRPLRDARLRVTIGADGAMEGYMSGYSPVEGFYDTVFGFRSGRGGDGQPAPERLRTGSANGYAFTAGHTCNGVYHAMRQMADGHRDPATGECTSISTQYRIRAVPAFVVQNAARGANDDLDTGVPGYRDPPASSPQRSN